MNAQPVRALTSGAECGVYFLLAQRGHPRYLLHVPNTTSPELARLNAALADALRERDAIDNCFTPEWRAAHAKAREVCEQIATERKRLAALAPVKVPILLSWDPSGAKDASGHRKVVPGRGEAGWTVLEFATLAQAHAWAAAHQFCATPCWSHTPWWGGVALGAA